MRAALQPSVDGQNVFERENHARLDLVANVRAKLIG